MKALVVDPDRSARATVKRLLSHVNVDVVEADNGLVALSVLEHSDPDFVVIEVDMPILNGPDCLSAIRQSPVRSDIPVICITASGTRENVHRMVALGVADFLLKPVNPVDALPRIRNLLVRVAHWRQRQSTRSINSLMVVDNDPDFISFVRPLLDQEFEVIEAASSTAAAIGYRDASPKPTVVCLAEGLPLMNEDLVLEVMRKMALEDGASPPQFYLLAKSAEVPAEKAERYAGVVRKSTVPQTFVEEFRRVVRREQSPYERLGHVVRGGLLTELVSATQQTIGVMMGNEIAEIPEGEGVEVPRGVLVEVPQGDAATGVGVVIRMVSGRREVESMASRIVRREIAFESGAGEVMGELASTIAGRIRTCLAARGFELKLESPIIRETAADDASANGGEIEASYRCASGEVFGVSLKLRQGEPAVVAPPAPAAAAPAPGSELETAVVEVRGGEAPAGEPATEEARAQKSADDVLF